MAQVSLRINGYAYMLGCADGEEEHLRALAEDLDQRIDALKASAGPSGEARLLLMAALMLSDELHDLRSRSGSEADPSEATSSEKAVSKAGRRLTRLSKRAEAIAAAVDAPDPVPVSEPESHPGSDHEENIAAKPEDA